MPDPGNVADVMECGLTYGHQLPFDREREVERERESIKNVMLVTC